MRAYTYLAAALLIACSGPAREPAPSGGGSGATLEPVPGPNEEDGEPRAPEAHEEVPRVESPPFEPGPCRAGEASVLGQSTARRHAVAVAFGREGGLAAFALDGEHVSVRRIDADGRPVGEAVTLEMRGAMDLRGLHRIGERYVLATHALCPETRRMNKCLFLRALSGTGASLGALFQHETVEWSSGPMIAAGDVLVVLRSHTYMPPVLERYRVSRDGAITREQLGDLSHGIARGDDVPPAGLALAVDGTSVAALVGLETEERAGHFLHFDDGRSAAVARQLPADARVHHMRFAGSDALEVVWSREGGTLFRARIGTDGRLIEGPARVADAALREGPLLPTISRESERGPAVFGLAFAGTRMVDPPIDLGTPAAAAAAGEHGSYAVVTVGRSRDVELRSVSCGR